MPKEVAIPLIIVGSIALIFIALTLIMGFIYFNRVFRRKKAGIDSNLHMTTNSENHPDKLWLDSLAREEINMKSFDKLNLKGYFFNNNDSNKLVIMVHGYHGTYRSLAYQAKMFYNHGYSLLMIDLRCHGSSEGKHFSMGQKETRDLKDWANLMIKRNPNFRIALFGVSMGGHIVMMASDKLPFNVMCAIEDCGFTSTYRQLLYTSNITRAPVFRFSTWACSVVSKIFFRFSCHNNAKKSISKARIPFMFMHGELDGVVPYVNLDRAASYFPKNIYKEVYTFRECDHLEAIHLKPELYNEKITRFVDMFIK